MFPNADSFCREEEDEQGYDLGRLSSSAFSHWATIHHSDDTSIAFDRKFMGDNPHQLQEHIFI